MAEGRGIESAGAVQWLPDHAPALSVWVAGKPRPKGSLDGLASGKARENNDASLPWRKHVAAVCRAHWRVQVVTPLAVPVAVRLRFLFERGIGERRWPVPATTRTGDIDKLSRNVLDALSDCDSRCSISCAKHSGVIKDDALICDLDATARYALPNGHAGVLIEIRELDLQSIDLANQNAEISAYGRIEGF